MSTNLVSTGTYRTSAACAAKVSTVPKAGKRSTPLTRNSTGFERSCVMNSTASTSACVTSATVHVQFPGSSELKPPPDMVWQKQAIATLQRYTSIPFVDRISAPEPRKSA